MSKIERLYNLKVVQSGKRLEVYKYSYPVREGKESNNKEGRRGKKELSKEEKKINTQNRKKQNLFNARNTIIRLISANTDLMTFITLTYAENMQDIKQSRKDLNIFFKRLKRSYKDFKYLWVMEYQLRGAIHFHLLTNIPINFKTAKPKEKKEQQQKDFENSFNSRYWNNGFIDIRNLQNENEIRNISKYVASYLVQDLLDLDLGGNRVFGYSQNLNKPITQKLETRDTIEDLISLDNYKLQYVNQYDLYYRNKLNEEVKGNVNYFDYIKKD